MEDMDLTSKLKVLRAHMVWKCMNKTEVLGEHEDTWKLNGLADLHGQYRILSSEDLSTNTPTTHTLVEDNDRDTDKKSRNTVSISAVVTDLTSTSTTSSCSSSSRSMKSSGSAVKIAVDIGLNNHWTDLVCGIDNTQL